MSDRYRWTTHDCAVCGKARKPLMVTMFFFALGMTAAVAGDVWGTLLMGFCSGGWAGIWYEQFLTNQHRNDRHD